MSIHVSYGKDDDDNDVAILHDGTTLVNVVAVGEGNLELLVKTVAVMAEGCGSLAQAMSEYQHRGLLH